MNRRGFLGALTAIAGTLTLDPERLLWVPGKKKIFTAAIEPLDYGWTQVAGMFPARLDIEDLRGITLDPNGLAMAKLGDSLFIHSQRKGKIKRGSPMIWADPKTVRMATDAECRDISRLAGVAV